MSQYNIQLDDFSEKVLLNDLLDIQDWINQAVAGKLDNCKQKMAITERQRLITEGATTMPVSDDALCQQALARPDYKNRQQRETPPQQ